MRLTTAVLRPAARTWLRRVQSELSLLPVPSNAARQHVPGPDADRVLVFGNGPATGFGVRSQELGLPGQLARELGRATGRGVEVDLGRGRGMTIESAPPRLDQLRLWRYDSIVVTLGATDAGGLLPEERWETGLLALLDAVRVRSSPTTAVAVLGIRPQARTPQGIGLFDRAVDAHACRLDAVTARICAQECVDFVPLTPALEAVGETRYFTPGSYQAIAEQVALALAPRLDARHADGEWEALRAWRDGAATDEAGRQEAVDRMGLTTRPATPRLERLVRSAADLFGTAYAHVGILDGDRLVSKAALGIEGGSIPRRVTICDETVRREGAFVVGDALADPVASRYGMQVDGAPVRFYAGHPLESPDGYRLGTLCVFDTVARESSRIDEERLRELAVRVQNELWDEVGWAPAI